MATPNQKQVFTKVAKKVGKGGKISISKEMAGIYSPSVAKNPKKLTESKGWQELLATIDDEELIEKLYVIATDIKDKRACMEAIKEIFKLKDKYPANKYKAEGFDNELKGLFFNIGKDQEKGERG